MAVPLFLCTYVSSDICHFANCLILERRSGVLNAMPTLQIHIVMKTTTLMADQPVNNLSILKCTDFL